MTKKIVTLFLIIVLSGCTYSSTKPPANLPTETEQLCHELKRNIVFNATSGPSFGAASVTQKAEMNRLYEKHNCSKLDTK